jgi:hypothetical protein
MALHYFNHTRQERHDDDVQFGAKKSQMQFLYLVLNKDISWVKIGVTSHDREQLVRRYTSNIGRVHHCTLIRITNSKFYTM